MKFERITELANNTPVAELCAVWGATPEQVEQRKTAVACMTLVEAGELAAVYGLKLPDILAV